MLTAPLGRFRAGTKGAAAVVLAAGLRLSPALTSSTRAADSAPCTPTRTAGAPSCARSGVHVNPRSAPDPQAPVIATSPDGGFPGVQCQVKGGRATYGGYRHTWWGKTPAAGTAPSA